MAQKGYWALCEDVYPNGETGEPPSMCYMHVDGFFNAEVMGENRLEALVRTKRKLRENINFLDKCWYDIPAPSTSDTPPATKQKNGAVLVFIPLKEMGIDESVVEQAA